MDGSLQVEHAGYPGIGQFFPPGVAPADCGFFVRHGSTVDGFDCYSHDYTAAVDTESMPFHPVSQTQSADGLQVTTVMDTSADLSGVLFKVTNVTTYHPGDEWLLVKNTVLNQSRSAQTVDLFAAGDIYLADSDAGFPYFSTACPQVAVGGSTFSGDFNVFLQGETGSPAPTAYQEAQFDTIWEVIGSGGDFANTVDSDYIDNGAGLEWHVTIPAGGTCAVTYYWVFGSVSCVTNATITGVKFNDLNNNGVWDTPAEPGLAGWTIVLKQGTTVADTTTTDANGEYRFTVAPGSYLVGEISQPGWWQVPPPSGYYVYPVTVAAGQVVSGLNFANTTNLDECLRCNIANNGASLHLTWIDPRCTLQSNTNFPSGPWYPVTPQDTNQATVSLSGRQAEFFRLVRP